MTITSLVQKNQYTGNGTLDYYDFTFRILDSSHLFVYVNEVLQTETTHYSVSTGPWPTGGTVTFVTAPQNGHNVTLVRSTPLKQETDLIEGDKQPAETVEVTFDKIVMMIQDLNEAIQRTAILDLFTNLEAFKYLRVNATADGFDLVTLDFSVPGIDVGISYVIDGGGSTISTGIKGDIQIPYSGTITEARLLADTTGDFQVAIWKDIYANFPPTVADLMDTYTITAGVKSEETGLGISVNKGDILRYNVTACTAATRVTVHLQIVRT